MPSLALLRFCGYDDQNKLMGQRIIALNDIRSGYRFICLKNESNQSINICMIFVNINVKNYVPDNLKNFENALINPGQHISNLENNKKKQGYF